MVFRFCSFRILLQLAAALWMLAKSCLVAQGTTCGDVLTQKYLSGISAASINNFVPSVYYNGQATKYITSDGSTILDHDKLCVDGNPIPSGIQLYDDGTHGDDVANDGVFTRDCVHICPSAVDYSDIFGFAYQEVVNGAQIIEMDASKRVPYQQLSTPLTPDVVAIASSHALFVADVNRSYYPNFPASLYPNASSGPDGRAIPISALLQVFGDVFDYTTLTSIEHSRAVTGGGIYKWNYWDRRGGPLTFGNIGDVGPCIMALAGIPVYNLKGVITNENIVSGDGFHGSLHEFVHGVAGYEYSNHIDWLRNGDGMHVPGSCTQDHSSLQGPVWDWVKGAPYSIPSSKGSIDAGVRLNPNTDCASCPDDQLTSCCSFKYEDVPMTKSELLARPDLTSMSPLLLYIAGMLSPDEISNEDKTYYCMGSATDDGCGSSDDHKFPCVNTVDDKNPLNITSNYVSRFTFNQLVESAGGMRYPKKRFSVIRHAAIHISARVPSEAEVAFYTLLWRQHEIQDEPWERTDNRRPIVPWKFHSRGLSTLHSRLHGIDCGNDSSNIPSCVDTASDVCNNAPCGPGAICKTLDGQPLCICREGLVGDGIECAFPSETAFIRTSSAHHILHHAGDIYQCFAQGVTEWPSFIDEKDLPPYPGGQVPYAATSCNDNSVCPVGWRRNKKNGCMPPTSKSMCLGKGFNRGQCEAIGCCIFQNGICLNRSDSNFCTEPEDPSGPLYPCSDPDTCCYFNCNGLVLSEWKTEIGQKGNCGSNCTVGIMPDYKGILHPELFLFDDGYYENGKWYSYLEIGTLNISGVDRNMFQRCMNQCFGEVDENPKAKFLLSVRKNDSLKTKSCAWLAKRKKSRRKTICKERNLSTQGFHPAKVVCPKTCSAYL